MLDAEAIALIRIFISDPDAVGRIFTDVQLQAFFDLNGGNARLAAADALDAIAVSEVLVSKKIKTQHLETDGPAVAKALRDQAASLRKIARDEADAEDDGIFDIVDTIADDACRPERTAHQVWGL